MYEYEIQGNYENQWECVTTEDSKGEAEARLTEYRDNEPGTHFRVRRVRSTS